MAGHKRIELKKVKTWLKCKKINELWLRVCATSDRVSDSEIIAYSKRLREAMPMASEEELDRSIIRLTDKINEINTQRLPEKLFPIKKEYYLI